MGSEEKEAPSSNQRLVDSFDAFWFCYSPMHQMQHYYRLGVLDNCSEKWSTLVECLMLRTKKASEIQEIIEKREKAKPPHIWTFRTPKEASACWDKWYGEMPDKVE